jgi:hypothetical protein
MHVDEDALLAERFEEHRGHLHAVALRMLGSATEPTTQCKTPGFG